MSKKFSFRMLAAAVCMSLTSLALSAQSGYGVVLETSFEDDDPQPFSLWTQENDAEGLVWTTESGTLDHPDGVPDGVSRAVFRNSTKNSQSTGRKVRLVSPAVDISGLNLPILCFYHAQDQWVNDFDTLRVYYRMKPTDGWTPLEEYTRYFPHWEADTISLTVGVSTTFQVAFEATDNMGRGVVIDNVQIRSTPNCTEPSDLRTTAVSNDSLTLAWQGSYDSDTFYVKVFSTPVDLSALETAEADVLDTALPQQTFFYTMKDLTPGTSYWWSVRARCGNDFTAWASPIESKTSNIVKPPYLQDFNIGETGEPGYLEGWYYGSNIAGYESALPFINSDIIRVQWSGYSKDSTNALCFYEMPVGGGLTSTKLIAGGSWAYTATPQVMVDDMTVLQVSFWGYCPSYANYPYLEDMSLIVGLMSNPQDYTTFNPIDTVTLSEQAKFEEFIVPFSSAKPKQGETGLGKYVALAAASSVNNAFILDNFRLDSIPDVQKAYDLNISIRGLDNVSVTWERNGASGGEAIISTKEVDDAATLTEADIVSKAAYGEKFTGLDPWTEYYVYARNVDSEKGEGAWSNPVQFRTPMQLSETLPDSLTFEIDVNDSSTFYFPSSQTNALAPKLQTGISFLSNGKGYAQSKETANMAVEGLSTYALEIDNLYEGTYIYAIMPEMRTLDNTRVSFYASLRDPQGTNGANGFFEVGIMEDMNDPESFVPLDTIIPELRWDKYIIPFDGYEGDGRFFAVRIIYPEGGTRQYAEIDNLVFETAPACAEPLGIEVVPGEVTADITWEDNGAEAWDVRLSEKELTEEELASEETEYAFSTRVAKADGAKVQAALPDAYATTYYLYMRSICTGGESPWAPVVVFTTNCPAKADLPYIANFDGYELGDGKTFPVPCIYAPAVGGLSSVCPVLTEDEKWNGNASVELKNISGGFFGGMYGQYMILPEVDADIHEVSLSFRMKSGVFPFTLLDVMLLNSPTDVSDGDVVTSLGVSQNQTWEDKVVTFTDYEGDGKYIALKVSDAMSYICYIDSLVVDIKGCVKLTGLSVYDVTESNAELTWKDEGQATTDIVISSKVLTVDELGQAMEGTLVEGVLEAKTATEVDRHNTADIFEPNGTYYFYVRSHCTDGGIGQWSDACPIYTDCTPVKPSEFGTVTFEDAQTGTGTYPQCWKVMNEDAVNSGEEYIPYITSEYAHNGKASLMLHTVPDYMPAIAAVQKLDVADDENGISDYYVTFWGTATDAYALDKYAHSIEVGVMQSRADYGSFTPVDTVIGYAEEQLYKVYFDTYDGDRDGNKGQYIAFRSLGEKENYFFIDDVAVGRIEECPQPSHVSVRDVTDNSATIYWQHGVAPFTVKLSSRSLTAEELAGADIEGVSKSYTSQETHLTLTDLTPSTEYFFYVKSTCEAGGGESEWSTEYRLTTECSAVYPIPFEDDFDRGTLTGVAVQPDCWQLVMLNPAEGEEMDYPSLVEDEDGGRALYMYAKNSGRQNYAITPYLDVEEINTLQVRFSMKGESGAQRAVVVGVINVGADETVDYETVADKSFFPCDTVFFTSGIWRDYTVRLGNYRGAAKRVTFLFNSGITQQPGSLAIYIDNVVVEEAPACAVPENLHATNITDNSISIAFTEPYTAKAWEYAYGEEGFDVSAAEGTPISAITADIAGLDPATTYDIYVRSVIGQDKSEWAGPLTRSTLSTPVKEYDYTAGFEDADDNGQWIFADGGQADEWHIGTAVAKKGTQGLYISNDGGATNAYTADKASVAWAYRTVDMTTTGAYTFEYDWRCGGGTGDYLRVGLLPVEYHLEAGDSRLFMDFGNDPENVTTVDASEWISIGDTRLSGSPSEWTHASLDYIVDEEHTGLYNLVILWVNDGKEDNAAQPAAAVDNFTVSYSDCVMPVNFRLTAVSDKDATVEWEVLSSSAKGAQYYITTDEAASAPADDTDVKSATAATYTDLTGLEAGTTYYIFSRIVCGDAGEESMWSERYEFTTSCEAREWQAGGLFYDFETEESGSTLECFVQGGRNAESNPLTMVEDEYSSYTGALNYSYSRHDEEGAGARALMLDHAAYYAYAADEPGGYVTLPLMDVDLDTLQVSFWIRPMRIYAYTGKFSNGPGISDVFGEDYTRSVVVGVMDNPNDPSTFTALDTVEYMSNGLSGDKYPEDDPNGQEYWQKTTITLEGVEGRHIAFFNDNIGGKSNFLYLDDISVEPLGACSAPTNLTFSNLTNKSAELSFSISDGNEWEVVVADNDTMGNPVFSQTVTNNRNVAIPDLKAGTVYYVQVRQNCTGTDYSDWSTMASFRTDFETPYNESFENVGKGVYVPDYWIRKDASIEDFIAGKGDEYLSTVRNEMTMWNYENGRMTANVGEHSKEAWLVSPAVKLPDGTKDVHLTFDLSLTDITTGGAIESADRGKQDKKFMVIVSPDGGTTWDDANAVVWGNTGFDEDYRFDSIGIGGERVIISLSDYAGKTVSVAFFALSEAQNANYKLGLDNVHINSYIVETPTAALCQTEDYFDSHFSILGKDMAVGENKYEYTSVSYEGVPDTIFNLTINVSPVEEEPIEATVCEGDEYNENGFSASAAGTYSIKEQSAEGCVAVKRLNLTVTPAIRVTVYDSICPDGEYTWNGEKLTGPGEYPYTTESKATGCDSITTLVLSLRSQIVTNETRYLCYGETIAEFGEYTDIAESGEYTASFPTASGCDSIVNLTVVALPYYPVIIEAAVCEGEQYHGDTDFEGVYREDQYVANHKSNVGGCDSTRTLNLLVIRDGEERTVEREITVDDLPYEFYGATFDENTQPGSYEETVTVTADGGGCTATIHLVLTVKDDSGTGYEPATREVTELILAPNPVNAGEAVYLYMELTDAERDGLMVEVYSSNGMLVQRFRPEGEPVTVSVNAAGVYVVRVVDGEGKVRQGKLIVK